MKKIVPFIVFISLFLLSCHTIKRSFQHKDYDSVVDQFLKQEHYEDDDLNYFEQAYKSVLDRDKEKIENLKTLNSDGSKWEQIFDLYTIISNRQNNLLRVLPLHYSDGRKADLEVFNISYGLEESRQNAAEVYYEQGLKLLRTNSKANIRQSVDYFTASKKFYINYKDVNELIAEARLRGKNYVWVTVDYNTSFQFPPSFTESILAKISLNNTSEWLEVDYKNIDTIVYDYVLKLNLYNLLVSPDGVKEIITTEQNTIQDGWQYILDSRGNVKKDSLGNDIKEPKYIRVSCDVKETRMQKSAQVQGDATLYDAYSKQILKESKCSGNAAFAYSYFQINGDKRALSPSTINKLRYTPQNFPSNYEMVEQCKQEIINCYQNFVSANYNQLVYAR